MKWSASTWRGRHYDSSKRCELLVMKWHGVMSKKTWTYGLERFWGKKKWEGYEYSATSRHNNTTSTWMLSLYTQHINWQLSTVQPAGTTTPTKLGWCHNTHSISTGNSVTCNQQTQHHHLHLHGVTIYTAYQLATQYSVTSRHNNTNSTWMVSLYTQHINRQLSTMQPADKTTPPPLGWCHYIHSILTGNSVQCNQQTQQHLHLEDVTRYTA
jgi:hypothetical protein